MHARQLQKKFPVGSHQFKFRNSKNFQWVHVSSNLGSQSQGVQKINFTELKNFLEGLNTYKKLF